MNDTQRAAAAILTLLGPDPDAVAHLSALRRALGLHCAIHGCDRDHRSNGLCERHLRQHRRAMRNEAFTINRLARKAAA